MVATVMVETIKGLKVSFQAEGLNMPSKWDTRWPYHVPLLTA